MRQREENTQTTRNFQYEVWEGLPCDFTPDAIFTKSKNVTLKSGIDLAENFTLN